jgi:metallo-beta-lactamase family protein
MDSIKFIGATRTVTGSCYLLKVNGYKILIDCGMYQGMDVEYQNYLDFPFDPKEINFVVLTHAHLDHCGLIPKLFREGFQGKVYLTFQTAELAKIILSDSAKLQEIKQTSERDPDILASTELLYSKENVFSAIQNFKTLNFFQKVDLSGDLGFQLIPAGHILGAASIVFTYNNKNILFSGDIGRIHQSLIHSFNKYDYSGISPDYIVMESLYGGLRHIDKTSCVNELLTEIKKTLMKDATVIIPSFSVHRSQEILEILKIAFDRNVLPQDASVYLDSPMAFAVQRVYLSFPGQLNDRIQFTENELVLDNVTSRFNFPQFNLVKKLKGSLKISKNRRSIIIAGSGMADGGRVVGHLYSHLDNPNDSVIFVGYQAEGTRGRDLISGKKTVEINNKKISVKADIKFIEGFSAHADDMELMLWIKKFDTRKLQKIILTHGELIRSEKFQEELKNNGIFSVIPKQVEEIQI